MSVYTVSAKCPRCGNGIPVAVTFDKRQTDYETPESHMGCDPFTQREIDVLYDAIEEAAQDAKYADNGPTDDDVSAALHSVSAAERHELDVRHYMRMKR